MFYDVYTTEYKYCAREIILMKNDVNDLACGVKCC